jgi:hypothetical protein
MASDFSVAKKTIGFLLLQIKLFAYLFVLIYCLSQFKLTLNIT